MNDTVEVSLHLPKGYREYLELIAQTAVVPLDHVVAVIMAMHLCTGTVPVQKAAPAAVEE